jgi:hypothetical protein
MTVVIPAPARAFPGPQRLRPRPSLSVSAAAQAKLRWSVEFTSDECCWWGQLAALENGLLLADVHLARHQASPAYTVPDMAHYGDLVAELYATAGLEPWQLACWIHTHPAGFNRPSGVDDQTFAEHFGAQRLACMLIVTHDLEWYGELSACQPPWPGLPALRTLTRLDFAFADAAGRLGPGDADELAALYARLVTPLPAARRRLPALDAPCEEPPFMVDARPGATGWMTTTGSRRVSACAWPEPSCRVRPNAYAT